MPNSAFICALSVVHKGNYRISNNALVITEMAVTAIIYVVTTSAPVQFSISFSITSKSLSTFYISTCHVAPDLSPLLAGALKLDWVVVNGLATR
jgi:hypothetical protein